jgi:hypothetical protein
MRGSPSLSASMAIFLTYYGVSGNITKAKKRDLNSPEEILFDQCESLDGTFGSECW